MRMVRIAIVVLISVIIFIVTPYFFYQYGLFPAIGSRYPVLYNELIFVITALIFYLLLLKNSGKLSFGSSKVPFKWYIIILVLQMVNLIPQIVAVYSEGYLPEYLFQLSYPMLFLNLVFVPSLVEEFIFRGFFYEYISGGTDKLYNIFGWNLSLSTLVTATLFGLFHTTFFLYSSEFLGAVKIFVFTLSLGLICGYLKQRNKGLLSPLILHLLYNFLAIFVPKILMEVNSAGL